MCGLLTASLVLSGLCTGTKLCATNWASSVNITCVGEDELPESAPLKATSCSTGFQVKYTSTTDRKFMKRHGSVSAALT